MADVELSLAYRAIRHLLYYGCVFLLDIFSFSAIYAPTANFNSSIASDEAMQQECARYINTRFAPSLSALKVAPASSGMASSPEYHGGFPRGSYSRFADTDDIMWPMIGDDDENDDGDNHEHGHGHGHDIGHDIDRRDFKEESDMNGFHSIETQRRRRKRRKYLDGVGIVQLYASLRQGQSVKQWYNLHNRELANVDIRRFITFGIIKGFLYRVHKYAYGPRPEGFKYTLSHADVKSVTTKATSTSSIKGPGSGLGSSMNSGGGAPTTAGEEGAQLSRESSFRYDRTYNDGDQQRQQDSGAMSSSYQSANNNFHSNNHSNNISIRLGSASPAGTSYEDNEDTNDSDGQRNGGDGSRDGEEKDGDERGGGTAQEAIRFHQNHKALEKYLDGQHCLDEICTELEISERDLMARIRKIPWVVHIIHR